MRKKFRFGINLSILATMGLLLMLLISCSSTPKTTDGSNAKERDENDAPLYYDFTDVLVPRELKLFPKSSFVYHTSGFTAGVLVFKSEVERSSLIDFFLNNMAKDNWQIISSFKSDRTMLLFQKEHRWCVMNINDETFNTYVEIWVAPTTGGNATGLLK